MILGLFNGMGFFSCLFLISRRFKTNIAKDFFVLQLVLLKTKTINYLIMKKILIAIALLIASVNINAQDIQFTSGPVYQKNELPNPETRIFSNADGGYYVLQQQYVLKYFQTFVWLARFNAKHELMWEKNITQGNILGKSYDTEGFTFLKNGKMILFLSLWDDKRKANLLITNEISADGVKSETLTEIAAVAAEKMAKRGLFNVKASDDGSKVMIQFEPERVKETKEQIRFTVLDMDMKKLWENTFTLSYDWEKGVNNDAMVSNDGKIFIVKKTYLKYDPQYDVLVTDAEGKNMKQTKIDLSGKKFASIHYQFNQTQDLIIAGMNSEDGKVVVFGTTSHGVYYRKVDNKTMEISASMDNKFEKPIKNLELRNTIISNDGRMYIFAERYWEERSASGRMKDGFPEDDLKYNNYEAVVVSLDATGKMQYVQTVPKEQKTMNDFGANSGFVSAVDDGVALVMFNDNELKYITNPTSKQMDDLRNSRIPVIAAINTDGKVAYLPQFNSGIGGARLYVWLNCHIYENAADGSTILRATSPAGEYKMARMIIK